MRKDNERIFVSCSSTAVKKRLQIEFQNFSEKQINYFFQHIKSSFISGDQ